MELLGASCLTQAPRLWGQLHTRVLQDNYSRYQTGPNGAPPAPVVLHLGHILPHLPSAICLPEGDFEQGNPQVANIPVDAFAVRRNVHAIIQVEHVSQLEGVNH